MADFFCSFLDSRSLITNFQIFFPPKTFVPTIPHFHNPRTTRRKRKPQRLTLLSESKSPTSSSSPDYDIISIHEHSDGSLLFRFGDPSEIAENVTPAEPGIFKEIKEKSQEGFSMVKVSDGDIERKVIIKKLDKEVRSAGLTEVVNKGKESTSVVETESKSSEKLSEDSKKVELETDTANSIAISNESITVVEREDEFSEKLSEESKQVELAMSEANPIVISNESINVVKREDDSSEMFSKDSKKVELAMNESNPISIGNESVSVVERENESREKLSEDSNDVELTVQISSIDTEDSSGRSADLESVGYVEECSSEKHKDEISPLGSVTVLDESSTVDNGSSIMGSAKEKIGGDMMLQSIHLKPDPVNDLPDEIVTGESTGETIAATNISANNRSVEAGTRIETVEDGKGNYRSSVTPVSPQLELSTSLSRDTANQNLEIGMPAEINKDGNTSDTNAVAMFPFTEAAVDFSSDSKDQNSEATVDSSEDSKDKKEGTENGMPSNTVEVGSQSDMIEVMPISQLESEPILDKEADNDSMEEAAVAEMNESVAMLNNSQKSLLETRTDDDHSVRNNDSIEAGCEVTELKSIESVASRIKADFVLSSGAALLPHPSKVLTGGEDAYFISGQTWLGVADGVGQWSLEGVNPGVYAQELIKNCENIVSDCTGDAGNFPVKVLKHCVGRTQSPGSTTVLIAHLDGQALHVANIGDSGFIILRHGTVYKKSSPMFHEFHFPVQIARGDDPSCLTEEYKVELEEGDVIIAATDGLFDNLYDQEISSMVLASLDNDQPLEEIAELLAIQAQEVGRSESVRSPFVDAARAAGYIGYTGGKLDDVAVIVSVVRRQ
ncbi:probable protein phosphatase 2C BIPP2C1 isoform X1 [Olea europaea var. sylvestris]|uniref:probable protein phosphatase 2C BIPP2C1 isoform X1 n=1 Tax=Olea europaea var. sylvestris TaxID=158386 RepID=UPI000C1D47FC|nr:probable protein phosphatase 2C BIPP2C1 isoform X1 [Olea europaea var. sylvestris]